MKIIIIIVFSRLVAYDALVAHFVGRLNTVYFTVSYFDGLFLNDAHGVAMHQL